ncbi:MAG: S8 family peptidase [candidate division Zixibacteria bacterium]|nr:S8 family peptidase [candidate division Zixibacteria bacterium]
MLYKSSFRRLATSGWLVPATCALLMLSGITVLAGSIVKPGQSHHGNPTYDGTEPSLPYMPGQVVIKISPNYDPIELIDSGFGGELMGSLDHSYIYLFETEPGLDAQAAAAQYDSMTVVEWAHPNYLLNRLHPVQGSYPFSDEQYVGSYLEQYPAVMLDLANSHQLATGYGITVGVIDGGVDATYDVLAGAVLSGYDFVDEDEDAFDEPGGTASGHGTFVAGVVHLTAPDAQIRPYRVFDPSGTGDGFTLARAIERAVDDSCQIINLSLVLMLEHLAVKEAIDYAESQGVTVVAAAGNESSDADIYPAWYDNVMAVAAIDSVMALADFSSFGAHIDVCAPGVNVYSTYQDGYYAWWSGSSFAAPFVAGQVALLREVSPTANGTVLRYAITQTATNIDAVNPEFTGLIGGGLINPTASLEEITNLATATVAPDTLFFELYEGLIPFTPPSEITFLYSSNAPADYYAEIVDDGNVFSFLPDSLGVTNDSIFVQVDHSELTVGTYYNIVLFHVTEAPEPAVLTVCANILPYDSSVVAWATPDHLLFDAISNQEPAMSQWVYLQSTNAPSDFLGQVLAGGDQFTSIYDPWGTTDDSVQIVANPSWMAGPGIYIDTVVYYVDGVPDPVVIPIYLGIADTLPPDTCWVYPGFQALYAPEGVDSLQYGTVFISSSNAPATYSVSVVGVADFISLPNPTGQTNDSLMFEVFSDSTMPAGIYTDTLEISVEGCDNSPKYAVVYLQVGDVGPTGDTCWVYPMYQAFYAPGGVNYLQYGTVFVGSNNAPQHFSVSILDYPDFTVLPITEGMSGDTLVFEVVSRNFTSPGIYTDTLLITVDSVDNSPKLAILYLQVYEPNSDSLWLIPDSLQFTIPEGSTTLRYGYSMLWSKYSPKTYTAFIDTTQIWLSLVETTGLTQDTVGVIVDPSGLPAGNYSEIVWYIAEDISDDAFLHVHLTVTSGPVDDDSVMLTPDTLVFYADEGSEVVQTGYSWLSSLNGPAGYTAIKDTSSFFLSLIDTAGVTNDSVGVTVDPSGLPAGVYGGLAMYFVDGISQPGYLNVFLVIDTVITPPSDSAWVLPDPLNFQAPFGSTALLIDTAILFSSNMPAVWHGFVLGGLTSFMTLPDSAGLTNDSIIVWVDPSGLAPGWYGDTVVMDVSGVSQPVLLTVMLHIYETDSVSGVQNYPNPFNPSTEIRFSLPAASHVKLSVYNIMGQLVTTLTDQRLEAGDHAVEFDGSNVASGVYLYRLQTDASIVTRKMVLLK